MTPGYRCESFNQGLGTSLSSKRKETQLNYHFLIPSKRNGERSFGKIKISFQLSRLPIITLSLEFSSLY